MAPAAIPRARRSRARGGILVPAAGAIAPAGTIAPAGAIAPAGPDLKAAGPDLKTAGPDFEAAGPDFEAAGPDFEAAGPDSEAGGPDVGAKITGKHQKCAETGRRGSVWRDIGTILILMGLRSLWDASSAPKWPKMAP